MLKKQLYERVRSIVARVAHRDLHLLPMRDRLSNDNSSFRRLLPMRYTYRASNEGWVDYWLPTGGFELSLQLYSMTYLDGRPMRSAKCLSLNIPSIPPFTTFRVSLLRPEVLLNNSLAS